MKPSQQKRTASIHILMSILKRARATAMAIYQHNSPMPDTLSRSIFLAFMLLLSKQASAQSIYFEDDFDGSTLDTAKWVAYQNGYPAPAVSVAGGAVHVGQAGGNSLDFPYVSNVSSPFPSTGDFEVVLRAQYSSSAYLGCGVMLLGPANECVLQIWKGPADVAVGIQAGWVAISGLDFHEYKLTYRSGNIAVGIDGSEVLRGPANARPTNIWFGHPTIGQVLCTGQANGFVDQTTGVVFGRWWGIGGVWTTFQIDSIRVTSIPSDTTPPALLCPSAAMSLIPKTGIGDFVFYSVMVSDATDTSPSIVCVPPSGSFFPRGTTIVTCTATDLSGNRSVCMFPVVVMPTVLRR